MRIFTYFFLTLILFVAILGGCTKQELIRIACVGDSITFGAGIEGRDSLAYPPKLNALLGSDYIVKNYGVSGRTLLRKGDFPYINEKAYKDALSWNPNVILIKLGTNDTKPQNWQYGKEYKTDYIDLIESFQKLSSRPRVILVKPVPAFQSNYMISDIVIVDEIIPIIDEICKELNFQAIDLHTPMLDDGALFPDHIHPNAEGAAKMAELIYMQIK
ncbi:MAG: GDSL-type esterase/lipase family protein [Bacteroidales bacterium]